MCYRLTKSFPQEERYGLASQMRRAAVSIAANIAEGFNRNHHAEDHQFLYIALGSCAELDLVEKLDHESKMLRNLIKRL
ncbi:MAG: four helix bundle protein [Nitrospiraceae bacterium]|nr:MAG: four helix bundle protein [Nitrospiraceae bacterium]